LTKGKKDRETSKNLINLPLHKEMREELAIASFLLALVPLPDGRTALIQIPKIEYRYVNRGSYRKVKLQGTVASILEATKIERTASDGVQLLIAQLICIDVVNH
jgi:hypothetical protein